MKIRVIKEISIKPGQVPLYLLDDPDHPEKDFKPVGYTRNQLQLVSKYEKPPPISVIRGNPEYWRIQKIVEKVGDKYKVLWKAGDTTIETRKKLEEDVPRMLKEFEDKLKPIVVPKVKPIPKKSTTPVVTNQRVLRPRSTTKLVVTYPKQIIRL